MKTFIIPLSNGEAGKPIEISIKPDFLNFSIKADRNFYQKVERQENRFSKLLSLDYFYCN